MHKQVFQDSFLILFVVYFSKRNCSETDSEGPPSSERSVSTDVPGSGPRARRSESFNPQRGDQEAKETSWCSEFGKRIRGPIKRAIDFATPSNEGDNQEEKHVEENNNPGFEEEEPDYSEEQYPLADDKYKQLEDRLNAI